MSPRFNLLLVCCLVLFSLIPPRSITFAPHLEFPKPEFVGTVLAASENRPKAFSEGLVDKIRSAFVSLFRLPSGNNNGKGEAKERNLDLQNITLADSLKENLEDNLNLSGDVEGPLSKTTLSRLSGLDIKIGGIPEEGEVLAVENGNWVAKFVNFGKGVAEGSTTTNLPDNSVTSRNITDDTITVNDLASHLLFLDGDFVDLGAIDASKNGEGLKLPQANDCSKQTDEGMVCWDRDDNVLNIANGSGVSQFYGLGPNIDSTEVVDNTLTTTDLAQTLTFAAGDFLDLSAITYNSTAVQGLRLPNSTSTSPSSPSTGGGYISWDTGTNQLLTYNGAQWTTGGGTTILKRVSSAQTATTCGTTDTDLTGGTYTLPAGILGTNRGLRIYAIVQMATVGSADTTNIKFDFGGTDVLISQIGSNKGYQDINGIFYNRNSASSQIHIFQVLRPGDIGNLSNDNGAVSSDRIVNTSSINTATAQTIAIQCLDSNSGVGGDNDTVTLHMLIIELLGTD